ncbi:MAG: hypothetical protein HQ591_11830 [candidate division Zixibacteria bacterium]|nr:hypothetical protein [Candidatus Tariuqbacter arcticus]
MYSESEIIIEFLNFITKMGDLHSLWFVEVSAKPVDEIIRKHNLDAEKDIWIFKTANSPFEAKRIYEYFTGFIGTDGVYSNNDNEPKNIFMFRKDRPITNNG